MTSRTIVSYQAQPCFRFVSDRVNPTMQQTAPPDLATYPLPMSGESDVFNPVFIATHHKAGTVWINSTFRRISKLCNYPFIHLNTGETGWQIRPDKREYMLAELRHAQSANAPGAIVVDYHSTTPDLLDIPNAKGVHLVRDPRDMLISAICFHQTSDEIWLDQPDPQFGGQSFREKLLGYSSVADRIRFELDTYMGQEIRRMGDFLDRPDHGSMFRTVRYEDLIRDHDLVLFHELAIHLGFRGLELVQAQQAFWNQSLFGGMKDVVDTEDHTHIRDAAPEQWREGLTPETLDLIHQRVSPIIERLGYPLS